MITQLPNGWSVNVDRGPEWLFLRLSPGTAGKPDSDDLANSIWSLLQQHMTYRVVIEMDEVPAMTSYFIGQLVKLHRRIHDRGGLMRISGLSDNSLQSIRTTNLHWHLHHCRNREAAVMGEYSA